jgi:hypothetical protein
MQHPLSILALAALPLSLGAWAIAQPQDLDQDLDPVDENQKLVEQAFAANGIRLDLTTGVVAVPAAVEVRDDLLEYVAVLPNGAAHESLFVLGADLEPGTLDAWTRSLNAALLALGVTPGKNAEWVEKDPRPSDQELRDGASPYDVLPPSGDGLYLYAAWYER